MRSLILSVLAACVASQPIAGEREAASVPVTTPSAEARTFYDKAQSDLDNARVADATDSLQKALALDPAFASAHAMMATIVPQPAANEHLEKALAGQVPAAERAFIESIAAGNRGDDAGARAARRRVAELAPQDFRAHQNLGAEALGDRAFDRAIAELTRATELNPQAAGAFNLLGYAYAQQEKYAEAIDVFQKYAAVAPSEPNAHDSLAEALLNAGRLDEAEKEFREAVRVQPHFAQAWMAVGEIRAMRGDWSGAAQALKSEEEGDQRPQDKLTARLVLGTALMAQGRTAEGARLLGEVEHDGEKFPFFRYGTAAFLARNYEYDGDVAAALAASQRALANAEQSGTTGAAQSGLLRGALLELIRAQAMAGDAEGAAKTLARFETASAPLLKQAFVASTLANARGLAGAARGDSAGAAEAMRACIPVDVPCQLDLIRAQEKSGDAAGAKATRERLYKTPLRSIDWVYVTTRLRANKVAAR